MQLTQRDELLDAFDTIWHPESSKSIHIYSKKEKEMCSKMNSSICIGLCIFATLLFLFPPIVVSADSYKACYGPVLLRSSPSPNAERISTIPKGSIVDVIAKKNYWIKVNIEGKVGWAASTAMCFVKGKLSTDLIVRHTGSKLVSDKYRSFFSVYNSGTADFKGELTLSLFYKGNFIKSESFSFAAKPILPHGAQKLYVDTDKAITSFSFRAKK